MYDLSSFTAYLRDKYVYLLDNLNKYMEMYR